MNEQTVSHFRAGLAALRQERQTLIDALRSIDQQINATESFLESVEGRKARLVPAGSSGDVPAVRDVVMEIAQTGRVFSFEDVMNRLREVGNFAQAASVTSIISREPTIERGIRRGTYRLKPDRDPLRASGPRGELPGQGGDDGKAVTAGDALRQRHEGTSRNLLS